jgi:transposase InsO family protein
LIVAFIDECREAGHAVEPICRVLTEQGCRIAARTYRAWASPGHRVAARTVADAMVIDTVRDLAWTVDADGPLAGVRRLTPEGLYGRRKMTRLVRRRMPGASRGAVDRAMKALGLNGIRRSKGVRTTIPGKDVELVMVPLRMATWQRRREGHPVERGQLIGHSDAGSQYTSIKFADHLDLEGLRPSIGTVGDAYDNALMECVIGLFKTECIRTTVFHAGPYRQVADVEWATAGWVDWYNNRRLHSSLGYLTPEEFEQAHYAALTREPQPA